MTSLTWIEPERETIDSASEIAILKQALRKRAASEPLLLRLGIALERAEVHAEALETFRRALAIQPDSKGAMWGLGRVLHALGRMEEAYGALDRVVELQPDHLDALCFRSRVGATLGRLAEATATYRSILRTAPGHDAAATLLCEQLFGKGAYQEALDLCDDLLARVPGNTRLLSVRVLALQALGRLDQAEELLGYSRFLQTMTLTAPAAYPTVAAMNEELVRCITEELPLTYKPVQMSTQNGQKLDLHWRREPVIVDLLESLRSAVAAYVAGLPHRRGHPFLVGAPKKAWLSSWTVVLRGDGHQRPHIHSGAWLSGVYYAKVPASIRTDDGDRTGWIQFGVPPKVFGFPAPPEPRSIPPLEGTCLLFPSYCHHRTLPPKTAEPRVSVAFDVHPAT